MTFRDTRLEWDYRFHRPVRVPMTDRPVRPPVLWQQDLVTRLAPDPRLECRQSADLPTPAEQWRHTRLYLHELEWRGRVTSGRPVGWFAAEEFGKVDRRFHIHFLIAGVAHLDRTEWWKRAFDRFGRVHIDAFDPRKAAPFYAAKYAAKTLGELHFGGTLQACDLNEFENRPGVSGGRIVIARVDRRFRARYDLTMPRWHR
jgi:hypothetical protein